jgi:hypothetical protein
LNHPEMNSLLHIRQGYDLARVAALKFLEDFKQEVKPDDREVRPSL